MKIRLALILASSLVLSLGCPDGPGPEADTSSPSDITMTDTLATSDTVSGETVDPGDTIPTEVGVGDGDVVTSTALWTLRALGDEGTLSAMFASPAGPAYAVGGKRVIMHTGSYWIAYGDLPDTSLNGVWADEQGVVVGLRGGSGREWGGG